MHSLNMQRVLGNIIYRILSLSSVNHHAVTVIVLGVDGSLFS